MSAGLLHQGYRRGEGTAGGQQIVHNEYLMALDNGVSVDLDDVRTVLEAVGDGVGLEGELALFPDGEKRFPQPMGQRGGEQESPGLYANNAVDILCNVMVCEAIDGVTKGFGSFSKGVMSLKRIPGLGKSGMSRM